jgi:hypothetical protein
MVGGTLLNVPTFFRWTIVANYEERRRTLHWANWQSRKPVARPFVAAPARALTWISMGDCGRPARPCRLKMCGSLELQKRKFAAAVCSLMAGMRLGEPEVADANRDYRPGR